MESGLRLYPTERQAGRLRDEPLLKLLRKNPHKGLEAVMKDHMGLVYAIVANKLNVVCAKEDVEECVSDVFYQLYEQRNRIDPAKGSVRAFLCVLAKRRAIDVFRLKTGKYTAMPLDGEPPEDLPDDFRVEDSFDSQEERGLLLQTIKGLGEPDSEILIRKYYLGESTKQIAARFSMTVNAVDLNLFRSRKKLKEILGGTHNG